MLSGGGGEQRDVYTKSCKPPPSPFVKFSLLIVLIGVKSNNIWPTYTLQVKVFIIDDNEKRIFQILGHILSQENIENEVSRKLEI